MSRVIFDPAARKEFLQAVNYYEQCQTGLGRRFKQAVEFSLNNIAQNPLRFRSIAPPFRRCLLQHFPFALIYTVEPQHIRLIAVAHTRRKPGYWQAEQ
jgi:plasmid stabilization system protein ParE